MFELTIEDEFAAAHFLRGYKGKCERMHGHNYKVQVFVAASSLNKTGLAVDFGDLKKMLSSVISKLDHNVLDELPGFKKVNPSAENIAKYIYDNLVKIIKIKGVKLKKVTVWETAKASASYGR
jgi:6-pyruvoyltetrahydropterin/6-carboxytetrahydropterin synthase